MVYRNLDLRTTAVTVDGAPFRKFSRILHFHFANCASRRCAAYSDRAKRLLQNVVCSSRDSYQWRECLTAITVGINGWQVCCAVGKRNTIAPTVRLSTGSPQKQKAKDDT
jgi:hypothetical protein